MQMLGVSIVVCCYNSAKRLPTALAHLALQQVPPEIPWEVIVVDNASTDQTAAIAKDCWTGEKPAPLSVVSEPQKGLSHARNRGFQEAQYELVCFVDDDNWVCPDWVKIVSEVMTQNPAIGALGGRGEAVCEIPPPQWFEQCKEYYAVGEQGSGSEDITWTRGFLYGAGLTVRKAAWKKLVDNQFRPFLQGRTGNKLTGGEDAELCYALRLANWRLWYDSCLTFQHFLPSARLNWQYLRKLHRGYGAAALWHLPYQYALEQDQSSFTARLKRSWQGRILIILKKLTGNPFKVLMSFQASMEGDIEVLLAEDYIGQLLEILQNRQAYELAIFLLADAKWHRKSSSLGSVETINAAQ